MTLDLVKMQVTQFTDEYAFLSNFTPSLVRLNRELYPTVEHAFQAAKALSPVARRRIAQADTPSDAKRMGRKVNLRPDWESIKLDVMRMLLRQKFDRSGPYYEELQATWPIHLVEGNRWSDQWWGVDLSTGKGENHLGKLIMEIRLEIRLRDQELGR